MSVDGADGERPAARRRRPSLSEDIYQRLRDGIVRGEYRPNQRLVEVELAEQLDASRTPVRESLQRLHAEGLVGVHRRGWHVREYTVDDIRRIYDVRIPLEGYAARLAAERASDEEIEDIKQLSDGLTIEFAERDRAGFVDLHDRFHAALYDGCHNSVLTEVIRLHREHQFNRRVAGFYSRVQLEETIGSHWAMVDALRAREPDALEGLTRDHLEAAMRATLALTDPSQARGDGAPVS